MRVEATTSRQPPSPRGVSRLRRLAAVLRAFWAVNLAEELQYRANLLASVVGTGFWLGTAVLTAAVFFRQTPALGGWSFWQVVALLGVFNAVAGVVEAVLRPNVGRIVEHVRRGTMDLILSKPVDAQFQVTFRRIVIWRGVDIVLGLGLTAAALVIGGRWPGIVEVVAFVVALAAAVAIAYAIWLGLMSLAFWFVAVENLSILFDALYESARFPVTAYPGAIRFVLTYLLPMAWITTVPAGALTGRVGPGFALVSALVAAAALALTRLLWRVALRRYTSAGG